jgi:hypothetical protein
MNFGCQKSFSPSKVLLFSPLRGNTVPDRIKKLEFGPKMHPHRAQYEIYHKWGYAEADRKCDGDMNLIPTPHPCFNVASSDPGVRPRAPRANIDTGGRGKGGSDGNERFE